jgi:APA family basic amino acid/polyamine antiporter
MASPFANFRSVAASLRRTLSLWQVSLSGIGVILGAGVYALIGPAAAQAGNALWLSFLLAGLTAGLTACAYARLARLAPKNSPEFQYTALAFGPPLGFVAGVLMLIADVLAAAAVTIGFGGYLAHLVGTPITANAVALIVVLGAILWAGVKQSVAVAMVLTGLEALGLAFVIVVGVPSWVGTDYLSTPHGFTGISGAAALIFFAYLGFDELGNFVEEILGAHADAALSILALAATANTTLLLLASASRSIFGMAAAGVLPKWLARVGRTAVPVPSTLLVLSLLAVLVAVGTLRQVAAMTDAAVLVSFLFVNASLPWLAARRRTPARGASRVAEVLVPSLAFLLCTWLLVHAGVTSVIAAFALCGIIIAVAWASRTLATGRPRKLGETP